MEEISPPGVQPRSVTFCAQGKEETLLTEVRACGTQGSAYDEKGMPAYGYLHAKETSGKLKPKTAVGQRFSGSTSTKVRTEYLQQQSPHYGSFKTTASRDD